MPLHYSSPVHRSKLLRLARHGSRQSWHCRAVKARWSFDAEFGRKQEALRLLQEWAKRMATMSASFPSGTVQVSHGAIGVPESKLELEVEFESLMGLESFWSSIPADYHRDWTMQMKDCIVDGTPQWTVHHVVPMESGGTGAISQHTAKEMNSKIQDAGLEEMKKQAVLLDGNSPLDWKGDAMTINPGDKLPFKFQ